MRHRRHNIPKSVIIQDKYKQQYVLPKIQDEEAQQRLSRAVAITFALLVTFTGWLFLNYGLKLFSRGWVMFILGLILLVVLAWLGWWWGRKIIQRAISMRVEHYRILYSMYEKELHDVSEARDILIKAEGRLAQTEHKLDKLIASTHNRPLVVASIAAVSAVFMDFLRGKKYLPLTEHSSTKDKSEEVHHPDFTDKIVEEYDRMQQEKDET